MGGEFALVSVTTGRDAEVFAREPRSAAIQLAGEQPDAVPPRDRRLAFVRRTAVAIWVLVVVYRTLTAGLAFNREWLLLYITTGLVAAGIGRRHKVFAVVRDWLPFACVLLLYDLSRGAATLLGAPTLWQLQPRVDRWLFFGTAPTVWLQEQLKKPEPPWWEVAISGVYMSFFILPYVVAGLLWLRSRDDWAAFVRRFVALSFTALVVYVLLPAAPPWAAARCTTADINAGPANPHCMFANPADVPDGGLLGVMRTHQPGANPFVERISTRGWGTLHLQSASALVDSGQASVNLVAAIPSLHAGVTAMVVMFLWRRVQPRLRALLAAYGLIMAFALVYSAEHYVVDILLGWLLAAVVLLVIGRLESRRRSDDSLPDLVEPAGDFGGGLAVEGPVDAVGDVADVWGGHHGVQRAQRVPGRQGLGVEDVKSGRGEPVRAQCVEQGRLVDDGAA